MNFILLNVCYFFVVSVCVHLSAWVHAYVYVQEGVFVLYGLLFVLFFTSPFVCSSFSVTIHVNVLALGWLELKRSRHIAFFLALIGIIWNIFNVLYTLSVFKSYLVHILWDYSLFLKFENYFKSIWSDVSLTSQFGIELQKVKHFQKSRIRQHDVSELIGGNNIYLK